MTGWYVLAAAWPLAFLLVGWLYENPWHRP